MAEEGKTYMLVKTKPGKERNIWLALAIMKATNKCPIRGAPVTCPAKIEEVNFISGPYDIAVILTGRTDEIVQTAFGIRESLAQCLDDTLTLLGFALPITAGEVKSLIKDHDEDIEMEMSSGKRFQNDDKINFTEICDISSRNMTQMERVLEALIKKQQSQL